MANERTTTISIGGTKYTLLLTTKATKEIAARYGGLQNLGDNLLKNENFDAALGEIVWLLALLANQSILINNLQRPEKPQELLSEEVIELLTTPADLAEYKSAIMEALFKGTKRNVVSEDDPKNEEAE